VISPTFVFAEALLKGRRTPSGPGTWDPVARSSGCFTWTLVGSLRSPGDPSCAFAPLLDPGRTVVPSPWRSLRCCPRFSQQRRLRTMRISGLTHAASAPALLRFAFRVATHAQGWLPAGWLASTGRELNPLDHYEEFQITDHMIILPSCPPDAMARPFPWGTFTSYSLPASLAHSASDHERRFRNVRDEILCSRGPALGAGVVIPVGVQSHHQRHRRNRWSSVCQPPRLYLMMPLPAS
jgi:hypothetical protein